MKKINKSLIILDVLLLIVGCNKKENNATMVELKKLRGEIQEKLEQLDHYNGISS